MKLLVVNPNTTEAMTDGIRLQAQRFARPDTEIEAISAPWGPASIESHFEEELAAVATLQAVAERARAFDGVAIACYGDPGLHAAREISPVPVVGIAEASMHTACLVAHSFSVVTTLPRVKPGLEALVRRYGLESRCASIRATPLAVLDIERDPERAVQLVVAEARRAADEDGAEAILLGCAGMAALDHRHVESSVGLPVIDGVTAAVKLLEGLVESGVGTSRAAAFKHPEPKALKGSAGDLVRALSLRA
jgi:allantoin racemase